MPEHKTTAEQNNYISKHKGVGVGERSAKSDVNDYVETFKDENGQEIRVIYVEKDNIISTATVKDVLEQYINKEFNKYIQQTLNATTDNVNKIISDFQNKLEKHTEEQLETAIMDILAKNNSSEFKDRFDAILEKIAREKLNEQTV